MYYLCSMHIILWYTCGSPVSESPDVDIYNKKKESNVKKQFVTIFVFPMSMSKIQMSMSKNHSYAHNFKYQHIKRPMLNVKF